MRRTPRSLADARNELVQIEQEFTRLQTRIEVVRDSVADSLVRLFGDERRALAGLQEEAFMERVAEKVVARLNARPNAQVQGESRYVRIDGGIPRRQRIHTPKLAEQRGTFQPTVHQGRHHGDVIRKGIGAVHGTTNC